MATVRRVGNSDRGALYAVAGGDAVSRVSLDLVPDQRIGSAR